MAGVIDDLEEIRNDCMDHYMCRNRINDVIAEIQSMQSYIQEMRKFIHEKNYVYNPPLDGEWLSQEAEDLYEYGKDTT